MTKNEWIKSYKWSRAAGKSHMEAVKIADHVMESETRMLVEADKRFDAYGMPRKGQ